MKKMKKLASILLAAIMVLAMAVPAMATEMPAPENSTHKISITDVPGHDFKAYQIFVGDMAKEGDNWLLSNIRWGLGISEDGIAALYNVYYKDGAEKPEDPHSIYELVENIEASKDGAKLASTLGAADCLKAEEAMAFVDTAKNGNYTVTVPNGYYMIVDETVTPGLAKSDAYSSYIIEVVGNDVKPKPKKSVPEVDKQVEDESADAATDDKEKTGWSDTADHEINESFKFRLIATLAPDSDYNFYEQYKLVFHDTMSAGITFEKIESVTLTPYVGGNAVVILSNAEDSAKGYVSTEPGQDGIWTVTIPDVMQWIDAGALKDGIIVTVEYSAHLNENAIVTDPGVDSENATEYANPNEVYLEYSNNPNVGGENDTDQTPEDTVYVFTYKIPSKKWGQDGTNVNSKKALEGAEFELYKGTDTETADPVTLMYNAEDNYYYPVAKGTSDSVTAMKSDANGLFNVRGLDVGTYTMVESKTPNGYNTCDPIKIVVEAVHGQENEQVPTLKVTMTLNNGGEDQVATVNDVINKKGAVLPETGGIGTTIFYVLGTILVVGAVILLVTKKRMSAEK